MSTLAADGKTGSLQNHAQTQDSDWRRTTEHFEQVVYLVRPITAASRSLSPIPLCFHSAYCEIVYLGDRLPHTVARFYNG